MGRRAALLRALFGQLAATLGGGYVLEFRMDGAFFRREIIELLERHGAEFAIRGWASRRWCRRRGCGSWWTTT